MGSTNAQVMYIYKLPHQERKELCRILDQNDKWEELGGTHMGFDVMTLQHIRREIFRGHSPTEELLTLWGHQNHTVLELFILLSRMQHYQSMVTLKPFVDAKYHRLIHEGEHNLSNLMQRLQVRNKHEPCTKDLGIADENFDSSPKILNNAPAVLPKRSINANVKVAQTSLHARSPGQVSREDNESLPDNNNQLNPVEDGRVRRPSGGYDIISEGAAGRPLLCFQISYDELREATSNWDPATVLGKGGFGTVFKGTWKCTLVAIKRIEQREDTPESHNIQLKQSITELHCLNVYRHDNVLPLYGYSLSGPQPCLVYQYMSGGCLEQRLRVRDSVKQLNWAKRLSVAKGVARGLQFLHTIGDKPLIHGDIKSANILLGLNDEPRIGDFGLAREGPQSDYTHIKVSRIHGTRPYLPDEFLRAKKISTKVDTYSYGVVLFEIATGLSAYSEGRPNKFLKEHVIAYEGDIKGLMDSRAGLENDRYFLNFIEIGKVCVSKKAKERPEMRAVLMYLEQIEYNQ